MIDITECFDGDYIFRITNDDAAHLIIDDKVLIDNGGEHGPSNKWAHIKLERGKQYNMQVRADAVPLITAQTGEI